MFDSLAIHSRSGWTGPKLAKAVETAQRAGITVYPMTYSAQATPCTAQPSDAPPLPGGEDYAGAIVELAG